MIKKLSYLVINKIRYQQKLCSFKRKNGIKFLHSGFTVENPEFINVASDAAFGDNCKLICIRNYNGEEFTPNLTIGRNFHATSNLRIQCANKVQIGDDVLFASNVFIIDYNHGLSPETASYLETPLEMHIKDDKILGGVCIKDGAWLGNSVTVLPGVTIGEKSIIGACSCVCKDVPAYSIAVGNPAKVIKKYNFLIKEWQKV